MLLPEASLSKWPVFLLPHLTHLTPPQEDGGACPAGRSHREHLSDCNICGGSWRWYHLRPEENHFHLQYIFLQARSPTISNEEDLSSHSVIYSSNHQELGVCWEMNSRSVMISPSQWRCSVHVLSSWVCFSPCFLNYNLHSKHFFL